MLRGRLALRDKRRLGRALINPDFEHVGPDAAIGGREVFRVRVGPFQTESDAILEDLEVSLGSLREELHIFAKKRGTMVGNITVIDNGDEIDCRRMGSGGYAIPSICEASIMSANTGIS